jgi:hypothetical protein
LAHCDSMSIDVNWSTLLFGVTDRVIASLRASTSACGWTVVILMAVAAGCNNGSSLEQLQEAQRLSSDLLSRFANVTDAGNRAVMAGTDETATAYAREAEQATEAVQREADALKPLLTRLGYTGESRLLEEFNDRFSEYRELDRAILGLAIENTNLKAQRLSFGPAQKEADAFRDALESIARTSPAKDAWQVKALTATAVSAVREIQVLQGPHIAEADDAAMTRLEERMAASEKLARGALDALAGLLPPASRPQLNGATAALHRFHDLNTQLVALSRRNSNVRSLALSLGQKRVLTARCEESLHAIQDALNKRAFTGTR